MQGDCGEDAVRQGCYTSLGDGRQSSIRFNPRRLTVLGGVVGRRRDGADGTERNGTSKFDRRSSRSVALWLMERRATLVRFCISQNPITISTPPKTDGMGHRGPETVSSHLHSTLR